MSSSDLSLRDAALAHAQAGYHVIPLQPRTKARRTRSGTLPSSDSTVVRRWWTRMRDSNIGLVLNDLWVVVIDVDGPEGVASLAWLLAQAGLDGLPATYTVTTGRLEGGRHYWYALPPGAVKLVGQYGQHNPTTPHLDVLFQGLTVAAGSVHKSGTTYRGNAPEMPVPSALTELPMALYQVLARRGRPNVPEVVAKRPRQRRQPKVGEAPVAVIADACPLLVPQHIKRWLADGSDGRNDRTFKAVTGLVHLGWVDQDIKRTVLASRLGDKAREEANPQAWLQQKIDSARQYVPPALDREAFWVAVHTSGMSGNKVRLLDALLVRATGTGFVCLAQARMGIHSAISSPAATIGSLIKDGWMVVLTAGLVDHPTTYRLLIPDVGVDEKNHLKVCPPLPPPSPNGVYRCYFPSSMTPSVPRWGLSTLPTHC